MSSNALKQRTYSQDNAQDNMVPAGQSWEISRMSIAMTAEAACHLPGNQHGPDLEDFAALYDLDRASCFA